MSQRQIRMEESLKNIAAQFIARLGLPALITVTRATLTEELSEATIFISVFPEDKEKEMLDTLLHYRSDMKAYVAEHVRLKRVPTLEIKIDRGEKHRQHIDTLLSH